MERRKQQATAIANFYSRPSLAKLLKGQNKLPPKHGQQWSPERTTWEHSWQASISAPKKLFFYRAYQIVEKKDTESG